MCYIVAYDEYDESWWRKYVWGCHNCIYCLQEQLVLDTDNSESCHLQVCLARQPSTSEPDLLHFDIEWNFRPVSVTTEEARSSSGTPGQSNGTVGASNDTAGPSNVSGHLNSTSGPSDVTPNWARPPSECCSTPLVWFHSLIYVLFNSML